jgi:hypothetical protein
MIGSSQIFCFAHIVVSDVDELLVIIAAERVPAYGVHRLRVGGEHAAEAFVSKTRERGFSKNVLRDQGAPLQQGREACAPCAARALLSEAAPWRA